MYPWWRAMPALHAETVWFERRELMILGEQRARVGGEKARTGGKIANQTIGGPPTPTIRHRGPGYFARLPAFNNATGGMRFAFPPYVLYNKKCRRAIPSLNSHLRAFGPPVNYEKSSGAGFRARGNLGVMVRSAHPEKLFKASFCKCRGLPPAGTPVLLAPYTNLRSKR